MGQRKKNPPRGEHRIVFRHRGMSVDVFDTEDGEWFEMVQGDGQPNGPYETSGRAIEAGIKGAEHKARRKAGKKKANKKRASSGQSPSVVISRYIKGINKR